MAKKKKGAKVAQPLKTNGDAFIKRREVKRRSGLSDATILRHEKRGWFPKRVQLTPSSVAWVKAEVDAWQKRKMAARGEPYQPPKGDDEGPGSSGERY